jgi:hypothetical protein
MFNTHTYTHTCTVVLHFARCEDCGCVACDSYLWGVCVCVSDLSSLFFYAAVVVAWMGAICRLGGEGGGGVSHMQVDLDIPGAGWIELPVGKYKLRSPDVVRTHTHAHSHTRTNIPRPSHAVGSSLSCVSCVCDGGFVMTL